jgi:YesN/AraC family two-component response regulator
VVSVQLIERRIYLIRGHKVMIDVDLAELYGVPTKRLNERVRRNSKRFPEDFMFQLTESEAESLRSQFATSKAGRGGRRTLPYVFTEQGAAMLSTVLNSEQAIEVNIMIMRSFVKLRQMLESNEELNRKFAVVIRKLSTHDKIFKVVFDELKRLTEQPTPTRKQIGIQDRQEIIHKLRDNADLKCFAPGVGHVYRRQEKKISAPEVRGG